MNDVNVPLLAYVFVSITSLVLAYVTYNDETANNSDNKNAISNLSEEPKPAEQTSMLPNFMQSTDEKQLEQPKEQPSMLPNFMQSTEEKPSQQPTTTEQPSMLPNFMQSSDQKPPEQQKVGGKSKKKRLKSKKSKSKKSKKNI